MTTKIQDHDIHCYAVDADTAVITIKNNNYVLDYSSLMDFLTHLAVVASSLENSIHDQQKLCLDQKQFQNEYH